MYINSIERREKYQEQIKELFKESLTELGEDKWSDTFEVECVDSKKVLIKYHGSASLKKFKKACKKKLVFCVYLVMGAGKKVKITKTRIYNTLSSKTKKNIKALKFFIIGMIFVCIATSIVVVMCNYIGNRSFRETFYNVSSIKVDSCVRIIQLSDMHGASYGENNKDIIERVKALKPDIIVCTGDIVDSADSGIDYAVSLASELSKIAPSYYVYGNNEVESIYDFSLVEESLDTEFGFDETNRDETAILKIEDSFEQKLEEVGIKVLKNEKDTIKVKTMNIDVYGVLTTNPSSFWSYSGKSFADYIYTNPENLKITLSHEPFIFEVYQTEFLGDLMVSGHTHGGVVRIPVLGPLYTVEGGLFPEHSGSFVYGRYNISGYPVIVSSGLENYNVMRINNQPELVVIDINKF